MLRDAILAMGQFMWTPFAVISLGFAANSAKQLFSPAKRHRP